MEIIKEPVTKEYVSKLAMNLYGVLIKAVVDVEKGILALDAELHSDLERLLVENGSNKDSLWGVTIYPIFAGERYLEYNAYINLRPHLKNYSREVEDKAIREKIAAIVERFVK